MDHTKSKFIQEMTMIKIKNEISTYSLSIITEYNKT